jgi:hypothetical protein
MYNSINCLLVSDKKKTPLEKLGQEPAQHALSSNLSILAIPYLPAPICKPK